MLTDHVQPDSTWTVLLPGFIVAGIGIGITNPVLASATVSVVPPERSGMASGSSSTFRQVGIATGIAGLGAVFLDQIRPATASALAATPGRPGRAGPRRDPRCPAPSPGAASARWPPRIPSWPARHALIDAYQVGFTSTFNHLMAIAAVDRPGRSASGRCALVRQRDFVPSIAATTPPPPTGRWRRAPGPRRRPLQRRRRRSAPPRPRCRRPPRVESAAPTGGRSARPRTAGRALGPARRPPGPTAPLARHPTRPGSGRPTHPRRDEILDAHRAAMARRASAGYLDPGHRAASC